MVSRRTFIIGGGAAAGTAVTGLAAWQGLLREHLEDNRTTGPPRSFANGTGSSGTAPGVGQRSTILVILALNGGNDGMNTLAPIADGLYHDYRHDLAVAEADAVPLAGLVGMGLHPAMAPVAGLWDARRMAAAIGVGFEEQSRSHFAAMDTWWSAEPGKARTTGWLGRWLDASADPANPLTAVALGAGAPMLLGERATATVIFDPTAFSLRAPKGADVDELAAAFRATAGPLSDEPLAAAAQAALPATLDAVTTLAPALEAVAGKRRPGPKQAGGAGAMTSLLDVAADVVGLDIGTRVIVVNGDGFDTHADQAARHERLLADAAAGIASFFAQIDEQGRTGDVMLITTSEFGRRVAENGGGTDHGKGGVELLFGAGVRGGTVEGAYAFTGLDKGDLPVDIDTRSVYATALDWLGGPTDDVLGGRFPRIGA